MNNCEKCQYDEICECKEIMNRYGFRCKAFTERTPQTNADRIRAMSDEELAQWIDDFWSAAWCPDDPPVDEETKQCLVHGGDCRLCILDWLRSEVK